MGNYLSSEPSTQVRIDLGTLFVGLTGSAISAIVTLIGRHQDKCANGKLRALNTATPTTVDELKRTLTPLGREIFGRMSVTMLEEDQSAFLLSKYTSDKSSLATPSMSYRVTSRRSFAPATATTATATEPSHYFSVYVSPVVLRDMKGDQPLCILDMPLCRTFGPQLVAHGRASVPGFEAPAGLAHLKEQLLKVAEDGNPALYELKGRVGKMPETNGVTREVVLSDEVLPFKEKFLAIGNFGLDGDGDVYLKNTVIFTQKEEKSLRAFIDFKLSKNASMLKVSTICFVAFTALAAIGFISWYKNTGKRDKKEQQN